MPESHARSKASRKPTTALTTREPTSRRRGPTALAVGVSATVIDETVVEINRMTLRSGLELYLAIGELIIRRFYDGERDAWSERGTDDPSFRRLAEHPDLRMSSTALQRACASFELVKRLGLDTERLAHVGPTHLRIVLPLAPEAQAKLLAATEKHEWTTEKLAQEAAKERSAKGRGRKQLPTLVKTVRRLKKFLDASSDEFGVVGDLEEVDEDDCREMAATLRGLRERIDAVERELNERLGE